MTNLDEFGAWLLSTKLTPLTYKITSAPHGYVYRRGFAVDFPMPVHVCIHQKIDGFWYADEFLTGCHIGSSTLNKTSDLHSFLRDLFVFIQRNVASGVYQKSVQNQIAIWNNS